MSSGEKIEWCLQEKELVSLHLVYSIQYRAGAELELKLVTRGWILCGIHIFPTHWVGLGKLNSTFKGWILSINGCSLLQCKPLNDASVSEKVWIVTRFTPYHADWEIFLPSSRLILLTVFCWPVPVSIFPIATDHPLDRIASILRLECLNDSCIAWFQDTCHVWREEMNLDIGSSQSFYQNCMSQ